MIIPSLATGAGSPSAGVPSLAAGLVGRLIVPSASSFSSFSVKIKKSCYFNNHFEEQR